MNNIEQEIEAGLARAEKMLRRQKFFIFIGILFALGVGIFLLSLGYSSYRQVSAKRAATAQQLNIERTATARPIQTATAKAQETATAKAVRAQENYVATIEAKYHLIYGPQDGRLAHNEDSFVETEESDVDLKDFIVSAEFSNPYSTSIGTWDYGFLFRHEDGNTQYRLIITSDKDWILMNHTSSSDGNTLSEGPLPNLDVSNNGSNIIKIVCQGGDGFLYVNGVLVDELDLSARRNSGNIKIGTGFYDGNEIDGYFTKYKNFQISGAESPIATAKAQETATAKAMRTATVQAKQTATKKAQQAQTATARAQENYVATIEEKYHLIYGPHNGSLAHDEDNFIEIEQSGVDLKDFVISAEFSNPYSTAIGAWDYGFFFRDEGNNSEYQLVIRSGKEWILDNRTGSSDGNNTISKGPLPNLDVSNNGSNIIKIVCQGGEGFLYVNGVLVDELDLSARSNSGNILIGTGFYNGAEIDGYSTKYKNFQILGAESSLPKIATPTKPFLGTEGQKAVIESRAPSRVGRAPLQVVLYGDLVSTNNQSLCGNGTNCSFNWAAYRNGTDVAFDTGISFINTFSEKGDYTIILTACLDGNCETTQTNVRVE